MPVPDGWPGTAPSGVRSVRFFEEGTATANFEDNAFLIGDTTAESQTQPTPLPPAGADAGTGEPPTVIGDTELPAGPTGGANPTPTPRVVSSRAAKTFLVFNDGANPLEVSFDGADPPTVVHDRIETTDPQPRVYRDRYEQAISVRAAGGADFRIVAW